LLGYVRDVESSDGRDGAFTGLKNVIVDDDDGENQKWMVMTVRDDEDDVDDARNGKCDGGRG
jgi:hypothetical protein